MRNATQDEMDNFAYLANQDAIRKRYKRGNMKYDEIKKLWEEMMNVDITKMSYSTSATPLPPLDADMVDKIKKNYMGPSPVQQYAQSYYQHYRGISPTDVDAKGVYGYQEPERDEQGTFYGYKILHKHPNRRQGCGYEDCISLVSPRYPAKWVDGQLKADQEPSEHSMFGIHCTKRPDHPELNRYCGRFHGAAYYHSTWGDGYVENWVLVRCALSGTVVETEQGWRAEYAQIVGVYQDGNWTSYQDYQERAHAYSHRSPEYTWEEDEKIRRAWTGGDWTTYIDPNKGSLP